jgi:hypothetical protein
MRDIKPQGMYNALVYLDEMVQDNTDALLSVLAGMAGVTLPDKYHDQTHEYPKKVASVLEKTDFSTLLKAIAGSHIYDAPPQLVVSSILNSKFDTTIEKDLLTQFYAILAAEQDVLRNDVLAVWIQSQPAPKRGPAANLSRRYHQALDVITLTPSKLLAFSNTGINGLDALGFATLYLSDSNQALAPTTSFDFKEVDINYLNNMESAFLSAASTAPLIPSNEGSREAFRSLGRTMNRKVLVVDVPGDVVGKVTYVVTVDTDHGGDLIAFSLPASKLQEGRPIVEVEGEAYLIMVRAGDEVLTDSEFVSIEKSSNNQ